MKYRVSIHMRSLFSVGWLAADLGLKAPKTLVKQYTTQYHWRVKLSEINAVIATMSRMVISWVEVKEMCDHPRCSMPYGHTGFHGAVVIINPNAVARIHE